MKDLKLSAMQADTLVRALTLVVLREKGKIVFPQEDWMEIQSGKLSFKVFKNDGRVEVTLANNDNITEEKDDGGESTGPVPE